MIMTAIIIPMIIKMDPLLIVEVESFEEEGLGEGNGEGKGRDG
jgi:hypothetical protein